MSSLAERLACAQQLIDKRRLDEAGSALEDAAREAPENPWPPLLAAKIAYLRGERSASRAMLADALQLGSDHAALLFSAYRWLRESAQDEAAYGVLARARARFPDDVPLLREDAASATENGEWNRAYALWSDLSERTPDSREALHEAAKALEHLPAQDRRVVAVYGNCQADYIALLCNLVPALTRRYRFVLAANHGYRSRPRPPLPGEIRETALVWEQFDQAASVEVRDRMRELLPRGIPKVTYPAVTLTALWPFACVDRRPGRVHDDRYGFGDRVAIEVAAMGLPRECVFDRYLAISREKMPDVNVLLERDRAVLEKRDAASDVKIAAFVFENVRREHHFYGWGYPTSAVMERLILQLVEQSGMEEAGALVKEQVHTACAMAPSQTPSQLPLHPDVIKAARIEYVDADSTYLWHGARWTFEEYMTRYIMLDPQW